MNYIKTIIIILCISVIKISATITAIDQFIVGPNPFIIGSSNLVINLVTSTDISSAYYLYSASGELIFTRSYTSGETNSESGTNKFILATASELSTIRAGLYILHAIYASDDTSIYKKAYIIAN